MHTFPSLELESRPLMALSAFIGALVHTLRTPLSVVSNELEYLKGLVPEGECERAIKRCQEISVTLKALSGALPCDMTFETLPLGALLNEIGFRIQAPNLVTALSLRAQRPFLVFALSVLKRILEDAGGVFLRCPVEEWRVVRDGDRVDLAWKAYGLGALPRIDCRSLAVFCREALAADNYNAPLADVIIWAHGGEMTLHVGNEFEMILSLPVER